MVFQQYQQSHRRSRESYRYPVYGLVLNTLRRSKTFMYTFPCSRASYLSAGRLDYPPPPPCTSTRSPVTASLSMVVFTPCSSHHLRALALSSSTSLLICAALLRLASSSLQGPKDLIRQHSFGDHKKPQGENLGRTAILVRSLAMVSISVDS